MMDGCGVKLVKQNNGKIVAEEGEFERDEWQGATKRCTVKDARRAAINADRAAKMASVFQLDRDVSSVTEKPTDAEQKILRAMDKTKARHRGNNRLFGFTLPSINFPPFQFPEQKQ